MADNIDVTPGTGKTIAADEVSSVLYQRVKLDIGGDGVSTPVTDIATTAKQDTGNTSLSSMDTKTPSLGQALAAASTPVVLTAAQISTLTPPAAITGFALDSSLSTINAKIPALGQALAAASTPVVLTAAQITTLTPLSTVIANMGTVTADPFGANADASSATGSISAKLRFIASTGIPITGTVTVGSHAVTNAGTFAVQAAESDGANVTLGAKADAKSTATDTTAITAMQVLKQISASVQAPPSQAVTNAGTFAVQATLAAETTKVIGTVRTADGAGNLYTTNSSTFTAKFGQDTNLLGTLGTAFSTAGKVDVKGADGDVFVRQATGTNLHVVADSGTITTVSTVTTLTGTTTLTPGTGATNLGKAEDSVHTTGDVGVAILAVRDDTLNATSGTEGDYELLHTTAEGALWVTQAPSITNGWATFNATSGDGSTALTNTAQQVKATVGTVGGWYIYNPNPSATYVNFYNATSASVTVGTTNQQMVIPIPANAGANVEFGNGITFATAISISATTTGGGNSAPATALEANIYYK